MNLIEDNVLFVNSLEAVASYTWVYQHPDDELVDELIPGKSRPLYEIDQKPIFET